MSGTEMSTAVAPRVVDTIENAESLQAEAAPESAYKAAVGAGRPLAPYFKIRRQEVKQNDFSVVKHVNAGHFMIPLPFIGTSIFFAVGEDMHNWGTGAWTAFACVSGALLAVIGLLYAIRAFKYPKKLRKEFVDDSKSTLLVLPFLNIALFSMLAARLEDGPQREHHPLAQALFLVGALPIYLLVLRRVKRWVEGTRSEQMTSPTWMLPFVALTLCATCVPVIDMETQYDWEEVFYLFLAPAVFGFFAISTLVFRVMVFGSKTLPCQRRMFTFYSAFPGALFLAFTFHFGQPGVAASASPLVRAFTLTLYYLSMFFAGISAWQHVERYYWKGAEMDYTILAWASSLPSVLFGVCTLVAFPEEELVAWLVMVPAWCELAYLVYRTVREIAARRFFVPPQRWGPMSFMKVSHIALRCGSKKLVKLHGMATEGDAAAAKKLAKMWGGLVKVHHTHATMEDDIFFVEMEKIYPGITAKAGGEHEESHAPMDAVSALMKDVAGEDSDARAAALEKLGPMLKSFGKALKDHLDGEEVILNSVPRKIFSVDHMCDISRRLWYSQPHPVWRQYISWCLSVLPKSKPRCRFVRALCWANMDQAQVIGKMVYEGVSEEHWAEIVEAVPFVAPKHPDVALVKIV